MDPRPLNHRPFENALWSEARDRPYLPITTVMFLQLQIVSKQWAADTIHVLSNRMAPHSSDPLFFSTAWVGAHRHRRSHQESAGLTRFLPVIQGL